MSACFALILLCAMPKMDASRITMYSGLAFDLSSTINTHGKEANPILGQQPARQIPLAIGLTITTDLLTHELSKGHPRLAKTINYTVGAVHFGAGVWNLEQNTLNCKVVNRSCVQ